MHRVTGVGSVAACSTAKQGLATGRNGATEWTDPYETAVIGGQPMFCVVDPV